MLSKEAATDTEDQLKANAFKYFTSLFVRPEAKDITINVAYTTEGGSKIVINATAAMPADFTKLLGYDNFTILASSTAKWGTRRLRVAIGLQVGWQTLTAAPFTVLAIDPDYKYQTVIAEPEEYCSVGYNVAPATGASFLVS